MAKNKRDRALNRALKAVGGQANLARALGITIQSINAWRKCPPRRALAVEHATGGLVKRHELRPDVFGSSS